jgi:hypothetical protein
MLLLTQLSASSTYLSLLLPVVLFDAGNDMAFVPLTGASLAGVRPEDAGSASGLVNVTQQLGGALGLAVLVSVFGSARRVVAGQSAAAARAAFVVGADHAFIAEPLPAASPGLALVAEVRGPNPPRISRPLPAAPALACHPQAPAARPPDSYR